MKKILITGGSGFLGGYLVKTAITKFDTIATYFRNLPDYNNITWQHIDLTDAASMRKMIETVRPQIIIHNAAMTNVDLCEQQKRRTEQTNIKACELLSKYSAEIGARIIYISTDLVFDGDAPPYSEKDLPNPLSFYGWSKWQGEAALAANNSNCVIVRPAIMYGPRAILGNSFSEWMRTSWQTKKMTKLFTDQFRTPIYAGNLAQAILELAEHSFTGIIHLAGSERINRYQFGLLLAQQLNVGKEYIQPVQMQDISLPGKRPADVSLQIDLAQNMLKTKFLNCKEGIQAGYGTNNYFP